MSTPYIISGEVFDTDGTTAMASLTVNLRNEDTGDTLSTTTNASGQYVIDCANLTSGYQTGNLLTVWIIYTTYEDYEQHTITTGGGTVNLTLVTVPGIGDLRYFHVQDFYDYFHLTNPTATDTDVPLSQEVVKIGVGVEDEIDRLCNEKFDTNSGSYYTSTDEYHDVKSNQKDFFLDKTPIVSLTSFSVNTVAEGTAASWTALTEASAQIELDNDTGRVRITDESNYPEAGSQQIKSTYTYGRAVPKSIRKLAILMTGRDLMRTTAGKTLIGGQEIPSAEVLTIFDTQIESLITMHRKPAFERVG